MNEKERAKRARTFLLVSPLVGRMGSLKVIQLSAKNPNLTTIRYFPN
jgi:hypothetical protein